MYILGISCFYHDAAAVLIKDGRIIAAAEEERFSRKKHDSSFPKNAIAFCLKKAGITSQNLDYVVFYEKPFLKFERILLNTLKYTPRSLSFFQESMKEWFFDKLWIKSHIATELNISTNKLLFSEHHLSHMASSFYVSPFKSSALLSIDGVGEWTTTSWGVGNDTKIEIKEELQFPHSLGLLYSAFTVLCGFEANEGEYKLMGLAPYGKPQYVEEVKKVFTTVEDGSFALNLDYFSYHYDVNGIYTKNFEELFGTVNKKPESITEYYADIAASVQKVFEEELVTLAQYVHKKSGEENLCFSGGVALNSKANWEIAKRSGFKNIYIQPSAGDAGGALGAAYWVYHQVLGKKRTFVMDHAYFGEEHSQEHTQQFLEKENISYKKFSNTEKLVEYLVDRMSKGNVVGWVQDEFEWGPRALGHRSIIADPRSLSMKDTVNKKIKFRETFRPFAPSTTLENADKYFITNNKQKQFPFRFMLYVVSVKKEQKQHLGAITHLDGTARPQFVTKDVNPLYHNLINTFGQKTGTAVVLNTSFNLKGEPIVNTPREAYSTFTRSGLDILVLGNNIITKK